MHTIYINLFCRGISFLWLYYRCKLLTECVRVVKFLLAFAFRNSMPNSSFMKLMYDVRHITAIIYKTIDFGGIMKITHILFDLDGTITDPKLGITNSVIYALEKYDIVGLKNDDLLHFIGPPLKDSFMEFYGFDEDKAVEAINYFREYFKSKGLFENIPYDGIEKCLKNLKVRGYTLAIATSKPEPFAVQILDHFGLSKYFDFVGGSNLDNTRTAKSEVIEHVMNNLHLTTSDNTIMVGDRKHDILGAQHHKMKSVGVTYGYGSKQELESANATYTVESVSQLWELLVNL